MLTVHGTNVENVNDNFYEVILDTIKIKPEFIELKEKIRDQALVTCFSELYSEKMWKEYASDSEGICLMYNLREIFINKPKELIFYPVRYVDNRKNLHDIEFASKEYNLNDNSEPEYFKFLLSCLTKERIPYSSEAEWRLFYVNAELDKDEKGKYFDFKIKPKTIIKGKNDIFRKRVVEYAANNGIEILSAQDIG